MSIKVVQNLVSASKYSIKCPYPMDAEYITFHNTANSSAAKNEISYMINNNNQVSYHFAVDEKEVIQGIPLNRNAWHCGDGRNGTGNRKSIGIEVCYSKSGGEKYKQAEDLAIKFIAQLLHERKWGVDRVKPHEYWSGKFCPHRILTDKRWNEVISRIQTELSVINNTNVKIIIPTPAPIVSRGYLQKGDRGSAVTNLQTLLNKAGYNCGAIDGIFGDMTETQVRKLQVDYKLKVDGLAGNATMQVLEALTVSPAPETPKAEKKTTSASKPQQVKEFQKWLNSNYNTKLTEDNLFGNLTKTGALKALQIEMNKQYNAKLVVDGKWGNKTESAIRTVKRGATGNITRIIQGMLYCLGYDANGFDGLFYDGCETAVKQFQKSKGLQNDGKVGKLTFRALFK